MRAGTRAAAALVVLAGLAAEQAAARAAPSPAPAAPGTPVTPGPVVTPAPPASWEARIGAVAWLTSYSVGLEKALLYRRPILLTFYTDWCGWCRKLERTTFADPGFATVARFTVPVRLNGDRERGLASVLRVTSYPTSVLLTRDGREIGRVTGYYPPGEYAALLSGFLAEREPLVEARTLAAARPADPDALYAHAEALLAVGSYEEAREVLARVAALSDPRARELWGDLLLDGALTYLFAHEYAAALPGFEDYLARFPDGDRRDEALFFHGAALIGAGRRGEAASRFREAAETTSFEYIRLESDRLVRMAQEGPARGQR